MTASAPESHRQPHPRMCHPTLSNPRPFNTLPPRSNASKKVIDTQCTSVLFSRVFANQNPRRSIFPSFRRPASILSPSRDEKPATATPLTPAHYKCPLAQLLSLHILTNAPGVWGSILPFLKFYLNSFAKSSLITCPSPLFLPFLFMRLYTLSFSVACKSFPCHSYENCRVCTNNSRSGTLRRLVGRQESERQSGRCTRLSGSFFHQSPVTSHGTTGTTNAEGCALS